MPLRRGNHVLPFCVGRLHPKRAGRLLRCESAGGSKGDGVIARLWNSSASQQKHVDVTRGDDYCDSNDNGKYQLKGHCLQSRVLTVSLKASCGAMYLGTIFDAFCAMPALILRVEAQPRKVGQPAEAFA